MVTLTLAAAISPSQLPLLSTTQHRMKQRTLPFTLLSTGSILLSSITLTTPSALAQVSDANVRAVNVARNWAINTNGGLSRYQPAACMFKTNDGGGSCLVQNTDQGFSFDFQGGAPGWQELGLPATTETQILISPDGRSVLNVNYNGTPR